MRKRTGLILSLYLVQCTSTVKQPKITYDPNLGVTTQMMNNDMILSDGDINFDAEFNLILPHLQASGSCNLLFSGARSFTNLAGHITDPNHPKHKGELNHLSSMMQNKMTDDADWLIKQIGERLHLPASPFVPESLNVVNEKGPKICDNGKYRCLFKIPPSLHQTCRRPDGTAHPSGYFFAGGKYNAEDAQDSIVQADSRWSEGMCGTLQVLTDKNSTTVTRKPSVCCSLENIELCPVEAARALQTYNENSKLSTAPKISKRKSYCLAIESISKIDEKNHTETRSTTKTTEKPNTETQSRKRRSTSEIEKAPIAIPSMDVFNENFFPDLKWIRLGKLNFYISLSPVVANIIGFIKESWSRFTAMKSEYQLAKSINVARSNSSSVEEQNRKIIEVLRKANPDERKWFSSRLREISGPSEQLEKFFQKLKQESLGNRNRNRRSLASVKDWISYWAELGPISNEWNRNSIRSLQDWQKKSLKEISKIMSNTNNRIFNLGEKTSAAMKEISTDMCHNKFDEWRQTLRSREMIYTNSVKSEVEEILQDLENNRLPLMADFKGLKKICKSQTHTKNGFQCDDISSLVKTKLKSVFLHHGSITFKVGIQMTLPSFETDLVGLRISTIPRPAEDIVIMGKTKVAPEKIETAVSDIETDSDKELTVNEILIKLGEIMSEKRTRRDATELYPYLKIDIPDLYVFHVQNKSHLFISFTTCEDTTNDKLVCRLGVSENWQYRYCLQSILTKDKQGIRSKCPLKLINMPACVVNKPYHNTFVISTHESININMKVTSNTRQSLFKETHDRTVCNSTCVVQPKLHQQQFSCSGITYEVAAISNAELNMTTELDSDTELTLKAREFQFEGISNLDQVFHGKNKSFTLPEFKSTIMKHHLLIISVTILAIIAIVFIVKIIKCGTYPICCIYKVARKCSKRKPKSRRSSLKSEPQNQMNIVKRQPSHNIKHQPGVHVA